DVACETSGQGSVAGQDVRIRRYQQYIVEGKRFFDETHKLGSVQSKIIRLNLGSVLREAPNPVPSTEAMRPAFSASRFFIPATPLHCGTSATRGCSRRAAHRARRCPDHPSARATTTS